MFARQVKFGLLKFFLRNLGLNEKRLLDNPDILVTDFTSDLELSATSVLSVVLLNLYELAEAVAVSKHLNSLKSMHLRPSSRFISSYFSSNEQLIFMVPTGGRFWK